MLASGIIVLVLGVAFFVKYAFDRHWINETARVAIGTTAGIAVWIGGLMFVRRGYAVFGRGIAGAGLAMMFISAWAATALYRLVPDGAGFAWMVAVSVLTGITAEREKSLGLALAAIAFAYSAPFLVATDRDRHVTLFMYEAVLAVAVLGLVTRYGWPALSLTALWFTWTTYGVWAARFYRDDYFASTELFLTFIVAAFAVIGVRHARASSERERLAARVFWIGPVLYHVASVAVLFSHGIWFVTYVIGATAVVVALARDRPLLRSTGWIAVAVPLTMWVGVHTAARWYAAARLGIAAVYALHLIGQIRALEGETSPSDSELGLFHMNSLGTFALAYLAVDARNGPTAWLAAACAAWNFWLAWVARRRLAAAVPHALGVAATLTTVTIAIALSGPWLTAALAAEGLIIVWFGLRANRNAFCSGGALLITFGVVRLAALELGRTPISFVPIANARTATGAFLVGVLYAVAALYRRVAEPKEEHRQMVVVATVAANLLTVALLTADVVSYWKMRADVLTAEFARELSVSIVWGAYALGAIVIGFSRKSTMVRYLALGLFAATALKMFAVDLLELDGIYRIAGFIALGLAMLTASFLYQRYRARLAL